MDKPRRLVDEITKFMPAEIICNQSFLLCGIDVEDLRTRLHICVNALEDWYFDDDICRRTLQEQFHAIFLFIFPLIPACADAQKFIFTIHCDVTIIIL